MKRKIEILIVFMLMCLCATIIVADRYIETKIAIKSSNYTVNTKFENLTNKLENSASISNDANSENKNKNKNEPLDSVIYSQIPEMSEIVKEKSIYKIIFDETADAKNAYSMTCTDYEINTLSDILSLMYNKDLLTEEEYENAQQIYNNLFYDTTIKASKLNEDNVVSNYHDKIGFKINNEGIITSIEVYDKQYVFNKESNLYDFREITEGLGSGRLIIENEGRYNYYKLMYKYRNVLISFVSFYADGRNNICIVTPIYSEMTDEESVI